MQQECQNKASSVCMCTKVDILSAYCYINDTCLSWIDTCQRPEGWAQVSRGNSQLTTKRKFDSNMELNRESLDRTDGLVSCFGVGGTGCVSRTKRRDSLPSPSSEHFSGFFAESAASELTQQQQQQQLLSDHENVLFELTRVPAEDLAKELTLIFMRDFQAITPDELIGLGWSKRDKLTRAPNIVKFTLLFNRVNFWAQRCILEARQLQHRAAVLAQFIRLGNKLLKLQNLHAAFAVLAALQSQPVYRLKRTWALLPRKCGEAFQRLVDLFSADNNHDRLRRFLQDARLPIIPYLGLYMNDLVYIDACYPSSGGLLETQSRTDQMNNICRIISENQQSIYIFPSKPHIRRYLESQSYLEEMQSLIETENYNLSLELEPKQGSDSQLIGGRSPGLQEGDSRRQQQRPVIGQHYQQPDSMQLRPPLIADYGNVYGNGANCVTVISHRKSKSMGDASAMQGYGVYNNGSSPARKPVAAAAAVAGINPVLLSMSANQRNVMDARRNLIDDSLPESTADISNLSLCSIAATSAAPAVSVSAATPPSPKPQPPSSPTLSLLRNSKKAASCSFNDSPGSQPQPPNQIRVPLTAPLEPLCRGPLERKSIFKLGRRQSRSRYQRFWAELSLTATGPELRLYPPSQRLLLPSSAAGADRRHYKEAWKHSQPLANASLVEDVSEADTAPAAGGSRGKRTAFQINFDDQCDGAIARHHTSLSGLKFSSYKYRVCHASSSRHHAQLPTRDQWVAVIRQAIDMCRQEKSLIDFNDAPGVADSGPPASVASATTASSSRSASLEWTCL